jgi:UTP-glucose-1-phosphate uridylyltransferase
VPLETTSRFGIAECVQDRVVRLVEKPSPGTSVSNLAIFGRYVATEAVIAGLRTPPASGELELTFGFAVAITNPPGVHAVAFSGEIYDCGTPAAYEASINRFPG